jgi:hypothetical protein
MIHFNPESAGEYSQEESDDKNLEREPTSKSAGERYDEALAEFRSHAVEGAPTPAEPGVVNRVRELFERNMDTLVEGDEDTKKAAVLRDTVAMINEEIAAGRVFTSSSSLREMDEGHVSNLLERYFGIK